VICHGGPFAEPEVVGEALARMPGVHGFYGATSMERLPVERGITEQVRKFTEIKNRTLKTKKLRPHRDVEIYEICYLPTNYSFKREVAC
jgi:hypothetical protein